MWPSLAVTMPNGCASYWVAAINARKNLDSIMNDSNKLNLPDCVLSNLCAPGDPSKNLVVVDGELRTKDGNGSTSFQIVNGTPILIRASSKTLIH